MYVYTLHIRIIQLLSPGTKYVPVIATPIRFQSTIQWPMAQVLDHNLTTES